MSKIRVFAIYCNGCKKEILKMDTVVKDCKYWHEKCLYKVEHNLHKSYRKIL